MKKFSLLVFAIIGVFNYSMGQDMSCASGRYTENVFDTFTITTVKYGSNINALQQEQELMMDIYMPEGDTETSRPLMVVAHGGAFITGERQSMHPFCERLVRKGYVCATIDYRLYPVLFLGFPDSAKIARTAVGAISDMKAAVRFFRQSYTEGNPYGIDTSLIAVGGGSAGAIAAIHVGYVDEEDDLDEDLLAEIEKQGGFEGSSGDSLNMTFSSEVHSVYNLSGAIFDTSYINAGDIPIFSIQGTDDEVVPFIEGRAAGLAYMQGSKLIHDRANNVGIVNSITVVEGGMHSDIYDDPQFADDLNAYENLIADFWNEQLCILASSKEQDLHQAITLFPNPSFRSINISNQGGNPILSTQVFDLQGRLIKNQSVNNADTLTMEFTEPGFYLVRIQTREGVVTKKVLIK